MASTTAAQSHEAKLRAVLVNLGVALGSTAPVATELVNRRLPIMLTVGFQGGLHSGGSQGGGDALDNAVGALMDFLNAQQTAAQGKSGNPGSPGDGEGVGTPSGSSTTKSGRPGLPQELSP